MSLKPGGREPSFYTERGPASGGGRLVRSLALFWGLLLLCVAALVLAGALPVGAKEPVAEAPGKAQSKATTPPSGSMPVSAYSDAAGPAGVEPASPDVEGGPDAFGYTFADERDPGGPVYNYRPGVTRIADTEWLDNNLVADSAGPLDDGVVTKTLPFPFTFYGTTYTQVKISTNGNLHFGQATEWPPVHDGIRECIPSSNYPFAPQALVAPLWYDFRVPRVPTDSVSGGVYTHLEGTSPNQNYIVEWRDVPAFGNNSRRATFEVILSQNGEITFQYQNLVGSDMDGTDATIGIQNSNGSIGLQYSCNQPVLTPNRAIRFRLVQDVFLQPSTASKGGAPGATFTYTETLRNQTGINNSFVLTYTGNLWPTTVEPLTTGTIANGASVAVTVTVQIPPGSPIGSYDDVTVSASSTLPSPGAFTATAVLTTSVNTTGVDFSPKNPTKSGAFNSTVTHSMRLFNRSGQTNSFDVQKQQSGSGWSTSLTPSNTGSMPNESSVPVTLTVNVPSNARLGDSEVVTISASSDLPLPGSYYGEQVVTTTAGMWLNRTDLMQPRSRSAAVSFGNQGHIYVLGGENPEGDIDLPVELYDSLSNRWYARAHLAQAVSNAGAAAIGDAIYVVGGTSGAEAQRTLQVYRPGTDATEIVSTDPLPQPRFGAGVVAVNGKLYVIGGADSDQIGTNTVFEYDPALPAGSRWRSRSAMPTARMYLGASAVDGTIYAVGGAARAVPVADLATVEAYNPSTNSWTTLASMSQGRAGVTAVGVNSGEPGCGARLYALGGGYTQPSATGEVYDPSTGKWRPLSNMVLGRRTHAAAYNPYTKSLMVFGGWINNVESEVESISCMSGVPYCEAGFGDVPPDSPFYAYVRCLACRSIVGGYADGTFGPNNPVTRGQLSKIVSNAAGFSEEHEGQTYQDVSPDSPFYIWVERLSSRSIIGGYPCGEPGESCEPDGRAYFRPNANSTRGQITKIVANAAGFNEPVPAGSQTFTDVAPGSPFYEFVQRLTSRSVMAGYPCGGAGEPCDGQNRPYFRPNANATRGQISKIVANTFFPGCETSTQP
ncbi:MAG TPA: S-layer homology domain-containing protein [Chloroflexia bacterium]|nr:S-layer homology domain-containing protein [Chloroflexia bacterium]